MDKITFEWDPRKNEVNIAKHGISFLDPNRVIAEDIEHSRIETRYYCFGKVSGEIITVRFIYRDLVIRIFGEGYWRKRRKIYEEAQS